MNTPKFPVEKLGKLKPFIKAVGNTIDKHSPTAFIIFGIAGMGVAVYEGIKASKLSEEQKEALPEGSDRLDLIKTDVKVYSKTAIIFTMSAASILWGHRVTLKRAAIAAAAYQMADKALDDFKEASKREVGEKATDAIEHNKNRDMVRNDIDFSGVFDTKRGTTLFIEPITRRPFLSSWNDIQRSVNAVNTARNRGIEVTLADLEYEMGLPVSGIGKAAFWPESADPIEITTDAQKTPDNANSCLVLVYAPDPKFPIESPDPRYPWYM